MQLHSPEVGTPDVAHLRLVAPVAAGLPSRYTRSIYENRYSQARQAERLQESQEIQRVADHIVEFFRQADVTLSPIIGEKSVSALYKQSLFLNRGKHPWLSAAYGDLPHDAVLVNLQDTVSRQTLINAKTASSDLVSIFQELLHNLIGTSLTHRLLGPSSQAGAA